MYFKHNITLAPYTTFRVGGPAKLFVEVGNPLELAEALETADREKVPAFVFGGGSNVLFSDKGFPGLVIRLCDGGVSLRKDGKIIAGAGVSLASLLEAAAENSLCGLETLAGIPGSFGGAIRGNAGAFDNDIGRHVASVKVFSKKSGMVKEMRREECDFGYRKSFFKEHPELVILSGTLSLAEGNERSIRKVMRETIAKREAKHPQSALCAGSFFVNPVIENASLRKEFEKESNAACRENKVPAGWLIDRAGLRGKTIGGAKVSEQHPNYIVNTGHAKAEDVVMLASLVKTRVRDEFGVRLQEEVQMVGF